MDCIISPRKPGSNGYTSRRVGGVSRQEIRYVWEWFNKRKIPKGLQVRHTCDTPRCINPHHLLVGTAQDNANDRDERGRTARHERHGMHKITMKEACEIRTLAGLVPQKELGYMYGISQPQVWKIVHNKNWRIK